MRAPKHVAFIMDGNGRWAQARGLSRSSGHKEGLARIQPVLRTCYDRGIEVVSLFAWSTENWARPAPEVNFLMQSLESRLPGLLRALHEENVRFFHAGSTRRLSPGARTLLSDASERSKGGGPHTFVLAFNYGGRDEIVNAVRDVARQGLPAEAIHEDEFAKHLFVPGLPDIDLLIRSGGERRVSNFMLWHLANAYLHFTDVLWPDMGEEAIDDALAHYEWSEHRRLEA